MNKKGIEMSFTWIFALLAGMVILFLAIFIASKFISQGQYQSNVETTKQIDVLLNPLQTGFEDGKVNKINMPSDARIYNDCSTIGVFGKQYVSLSQKSFSQWKNTGEKVSFENKYIFSADMEEGKEFYIFSKNFEYPFKISSVIYLTADNYCFKNAQGRIKNELLGLKSGGGAENFYLESCPEDSIVVCFDVNEDCDVKVEDVCAGNGNDCEEQYEMGIVTKGKEELEYSTKTLMYGAIFSDKEIYDCQVKRLMKRTDNLARVYYDESQLIATKECNSGMDSELLQLQSAARNFNGDFSLLNVLIEDMNEKNVGVCKLW